MGAGMIKTLLYILAQSMQVAGAEILIWDYWKIHDPVKRAELELETESDYGDLDSDTTNDDLFVRVQHIIINRMAFVCIAIGYLMAIVGDISHIANRWIVLGFVLVVSFVLMFILLLVSKITSKNRIKRYEKKVGTKP
jgi:hypothetical protein